MGDSSLFRRFYLPGFVLLCLLIGGASAKFIAADTILLLAALPVVWVATSEIGQIPIRFRWFAGGAVACVLFQLVPGSALLSADRLPDFTDVHALTLTRDVGLTVNTLCYLIVALAVFVVAMCCSPGEHIKIMRVLLVGAMVQLAAATLQYGSQQGIDLTNLFGYEMVSGFFRNRNHFSDFMVVTIPIATFLARKREQPFFAYAWALLVVFAEFVAGSDAGIALAVATAFVSGLALRDNRRRLLLPALLALPFLAAAFVWLRGAGLEFEASADVGRLTIASDTLQATIHYLPFGSGYGTFETVYPQFEKSARISNVYINHAHNEYLELILEGGVPAFIATSAYLLLFFAGVRRAMSSPLKVSALIALAAMLLHSIVDFPLRTMSLLVAFAFLNGVYFAVQAPGPSTTVLVKGKRRRVPLAPPARENVHR